MGLFAEAADAATSGLKDHSGTAINYFSSVRIPAGLIAGSALAALFSLVDKSKDNQAHTRTQLESIVLIIYHLLALMSLLTSLNVIVTSTAVVETIMFGNENPMASSAFELMTREYEFEFLMTRWSFFVSLFTFLVSVAARALLSFELLNAKRVSSAVLVLSSFGGLLFHLLAFVNARLFSFNNMAEMTWAVFSLWFHRSLTGRGPCEMASIACLVISVITAIVMFQRADDFSQGKASAASATKQD
jgi:hypothetical protein